MQPMQSIEPQGSAAQGSNALSAPLALWLKESYSGKSRDGLYENLSHVLATLYSHLDKHKSTMFVDEGDTNVQQHREQLDEVVKKVIQDAARVSMTLSASQWYDWKELMKETLSVSISNGLKVESVTMLTIANCSTAIVSLIEDERKHHVQQHRTQALAATLESPAFRKAASFLNSDDVTRANEAMMAASPGLAEASRRLDMEGTNEQWYSGSAGGNEGANNGVDMLANALKQIMNGPRQMNRSSTQASDATSEYQNTLSLINRQSQSNPKPAKAGNAETTAAGLETWIIMTVAPFFLRVDEARFSKISAWLSFFSKYARVIGGASAMSGGSSHGQDVRHHQDEDAHQTQDIFYMVMPHFTGVIPTTMEEFEETDVIADAAAFAVLQTLVDPQDAAAYNTMIQNAEASRSAINMVSWLLRKHMRSVADTIEEGVHEVDKLHTFKLTPTETQISKVNAIVNQVMNGGDYPRWWAVFAAVRKMLKANRCLHALRVLEMELESFLIKTGKAHDARRGQIERAVPVQTTPPVSAWVRTAMASELWESATGAAVPKSTVTTGLTPADREKAKAMLSRLLAKRDNIAGVNALQQNGGKREKGTCEICQKSNLTDYALKRGWGCCGVCFNAPANAAYKAKILADNKRKREQRENGTTKGAAINQARGKEHPQADPGVLQIETSGCNQHGSVTDERSSDQLNQEREDENMAYLFAAQLMQGSIQGSVKMIRGREQQLDTTSTRPAAATDNKPVSAADNEPAAAVDNEPAAAADNEPVSVADNEAAAAADNESAADGDIEPVSAADNELVKFRESSEFEDDSEGWTDQEQLEVWNALQMMGIEYSRGVSGSCDGTAHTVHWRPGFGRSVIGMALSEDELERKLIGSKGLWKVLAANTFRFVVGNAVTGHHQRALAGEHIGETSGPCEQQVHFTLRQTESQFRPFQVFSYRLDGSKHNHIVAPKPIDYENYLLNSSRESRWQQKRFGLKIWYSHWNRKPWIRNLSLEDEEELTFRVANAYRQHNFQRGGALADSVGEAIMRSCNITRVQVRQAFSWLYQNVVWESGSPSYSPTTTTDSESDSNSTDSYDRMMGNPDNYDLNRVDSPTALYASSASGGHSTTASSASSDSDVSINVIASTEVDTGSQVKQMSQAKCQQSNQWMKVTDSKKGSQVQNQVAAAIFTVVSTGQPLQEAQSEMGEQIAHLSTATLDDMMKVLRHGQSPQFSKQAEQRLDKCMTLVAPMLEKVSLNNIVRRLNDIQDGMTELHECQVYIPPCVVDSGSDLCVASKQFLINIRQRANPMMVSGFQGKHSDVILDQVGDFVLKWTDSNTQRQYETTIYDVLVCDGSVPILSVGVLAVYGIHFSNFKGAVLTFPNGSKTFLQQTKSRGMYHLHESLTKRQPVEIVKQISIRDRGTQDETTVGDAAAGKSS